MVVSVLESRSLFPNTGFKFNALRLRSGFYAMENPPAFDFVPGLGLGSSKKSYEIASATGIS